MSARRSVVLCADDFGLSDGVSRAISELAEAGRISATGAMTNLPGWRRNASRLMGLRGRIGIGLHLNLTTGQPLGPMPVLAPSANFLPLGHILRFSLSGRMPQGEVHAEIGRQLNAFEEVHGAPPDFVDGHQHVHVLPGVRQALFEQISARGLAARVWLRDPSDRVRAIIQRGMSVPKALMVAGLAAGFAREAGSRSFHTNTGFSGFSPLAEGTDAEAILRNSFMHLGPRPLIMCHPGYVDEELKRYDPVLESRENERRFIASDASGDFLRQFNLVDRP
jgi:predicted glycoside hydrolase/deacetylase ChbG (UPF0249 family)